jgi:hypothetical protein
VVCIFARKVTGPLTSLVKQVDAAVEKNASKELSSFVVFLTDDADGLQTQLEKLAAKEKIDCVPLTIAETVSGPESYKIDKEADVTVLLWKNSAVKANHAFKSGKLDDKAITAIMNDVTKLLED